MGRGGLRGVVGTTLAADRVVTWTRCPASRQSLTHHEPRKPLPPVTQTVFWAACVTKDKQSGEEA